MLSVSDSNREATMAIVLDGKKLKALRAIARMTQQELADAASVSPATIANFERGTADLRTGTIRKLLKAMKCTVTFHISGTDIR